MLPIQGTKTLIDKVERAMIVSECIGENTAYATHRTYAMRVDKSDNLKNVLELFHYETRILKIEYSLFGGETIQASVYSSSDRDAINALLIVLGLDGQYKFNIHGRNILGGK